MCVKLGPPSLLHPPTLDPADHTERNNGCGERRPADGGLPEPRTTHGRPLAQSPQRALDEPEGRFDARLTIDHFPRARIGAPLGTTVRASRDVGVESRHLRPIKTPIQPVVELLSDCLAT